MAQPLSNSVGLTGDSRVDGLLQGGKWSSTTLNYSLWNSTYGGWDDFSKATVQLALKFFESYTSLTFNYVETYGRPHPDTDLEFLFTGDSLDSYPYEVYGMGVFPDTRFGDAILAAAGGNRGQWQSPEGIVMLDNFDSIFRFGSNIGGEGFFTLIHEIGHALGLKHPHDDGGNARPTFQQLGIEWADHNYHTIMSYNSASNRISSHHAATPMPFDILALQHLYGVNTRFHAGDDVWNYYDDGVLQTLWDAGGNDTITTETSSSSVWLNLNEGSFSTVGNTTSAIAFNVTIENAIGSNFNDTILGNEADNVIRGLPGYDFVLAGAGNDTIYGGYGIVDPNDQADSLQGGAGADLIFGNTGDDILHGAYAEDESGDGHDTIYGGYGRDILNGQAGNDSLYGGGNLADPNDLADTIDGGSGDDQIFANGGNDHVNGSLGNDTLHAGLGDDTYIFTFGHGQDVITFFEGAGIDGGDTLLFYAGGGINSAADLLARMSYADNVAFFDLGEGQSITIQNLSSALNVGDIAFG